MTAYRSQNTAIVERLRQSPGEWVPMPELARISGSMNIHTRVWEINDTLALGIENQTLRDPSHRFRKLSFYRLPMDESTKS